MPTGKAVSKTVRKDLQPQQAPTPMEMLDRAITSGADIETLTKLMDLQERWEANASKKAFDVALSAAKSELPILIKSKRVGFESKRAGGASTNYAYADLAEVTRTVNPILTKYGLSIRYETGVDSGMVTVTCIITHVEGYSVRNSLPAPVDNSGNKNPIQAVGSTVTYLQRYTLLAALGLASDVDDDGRRATDAGDTISEKDLKKLQAELMRLSVDETVFANYLSVEKLEALPAEMTKRAFDAIKAKERKAQKTESSKQEKDDGAKDGGVAAGESGSSNGKPGS